MSNSAKTLTPDPATSGRDKQKTEVGSVFVSNYPPYSFWNQDDVEKALAAFQQPGDINTPLGLYMHIPFCRKRCKFCYFKVYTGKNSDEIQNYLDGLAREIELYAEIPAVSNRAIDFVYFGGGTPSFISVKHLKWLVERATSVLPWTKAREVAFECEPGTLSRSKLEAIKEIGVTRLSLGVEHFNDDILRENGRAHLSKEIYKVKSWIEEQQFDQLNVDLISGMVGENWDSWKDTVQKTIDYDPDSVTIYQLELPFNAVYSRDMRSGNAGNLVLADWNLKREWHAYAIEAFEAAGYAISSAYTMLKKDQKSNFVYRDSLWRGADMIATGVASFGHMDGIHFQNSSSWNEYLSAIESGKLPVNRAFSTTKDERLTRELILQLKLGAISSSYFQDKFDADIHKVFAEPFQRLKDQGLLSIENGTISLTREALLKVDELLPEFYAETYRDSRYT